MSSDVARAYLAGWGAACVIGAVLLIRHRQRIELCSRAYWLYLAKPWKLVTFAVAAAGITLIAPYTSDPTWDYVDASFMSVLTFATAPWVVGTLFLAARRTVDGVTVFIAALVWLFSASWSYDLYLWIRDGYYPVTWWGNLIASSVLYLAGGLFWNLDWTPDRGWSFAFTEEGWPQAGSGGSFRKVLLPALLFMGLISVATLLFAFGSR
jgi:hypothetical protein